MEKINFQNGKEPAINGTNLNKLQDNIEKEFSNLPLIQHGKHSTSMTTNAAGYVDKEITFAKAYKTAPTVVVGKNHTTEATWATGYSVSAMNITTTGFTVRITKSVEGHIYPVCSWIAVGN